MHHATTAVSEGKARWEISNCDPPKLAAYNQSIAPSSKLLVEVGKHGTVLLGLEVLPEPNHERDDPLIKGLVPWLRSGSEVLGLWLDTIL